MAEESHLDAPASPSPAPPGGGLVAVNRRMVVFDATGLPVVQTQRVFTKAQVSEIAMAAASALYVDPDDELAIEMGLPPSRFYGMTNLEVMLIRRQEKAAKTGDDASVDAVLDRLIGRPLAKSESLKAEVTYEDFLRMTAKKAEAIRQAEAPVVDVEVIPPSSDL